MSKKKTCTPDELQAMSVEELKQEAADRDIQGRSNMNKAELVQAICDCDNKAGQPANPTQPAGVTMPGDGNKTPLPVGQGNQPESITDRSRPLQAEVKADHVHGTLFACDGKKVSIMHQDGTREGKGFECDPDCPVVINGRESSHEDLRRGDRITCVKHEGGKVKAIIAHR